MKILVKIGHLKESEIDKMKHQYTKFIHMCGLDEILFEKMVTPRFLDLWVRPIIVNYLFIATHPHCKNLSHNAA